MPVPHFMSAIIDLSDVALKLQKEVAKDLPPQWVAENGAVFRDVQEAMVFVQRGWHSLIIQVAGRFAPPTIADKMIELAGVLVKAAVDLKKMNKGTPVPPERSAYTALQRMFISAARKSAQIENGHQDDDDATED